MIVKFLALNRLFSLSWLLATAMSSVEAAVLLHVALHASCFGSDAVTLFSIKHNNSH
jgi:hypothetical protein